MSNFKFKLYGVNHLIDKGYQLVKYRPWVEVKHMLLAMKIAFRIIQQAGEALK